MASDSDIKERVKKKTAKEHDFRTKEPSLFKVILHNDHFTAMQFVVDILQAIFRKSFEEASAIAQSVHTQGSGIAGIYTRDVAETKSQMTENIARSNGFPLRCSVQPCD